MDFSTINVPTAASASDAYASPLNAKGGGRFGGKLSRYLLSLLIVILSAALIIGVFVLHMIAAHNFHVVSAGRMYRAAQMDGPALAEAIRANGIKSILNLRGAAVGDWYDAELSTSQQLGVKHFDYYMEAGQEMKDEQMERLVAIMRSAPKPMLIHCKSGADRTGLVGALYLYSVEGKSAAAASGELTMFCGHVPYLFWRDTAAMDDSFARFVSRHAQPHGLSDVGLNGAVTNPQRSPTADSARAE
jgi:protein tyrosine phosphatase (PTP) superfamily phosphohydrolase (DUF442 family)